MTYIILILGFVLILNLIYRGFYFVCDDISRVFLFYFICSLGKVGVAVPQYCTAIFRTTYIARLCEYSISCLVTVSRMEVDFLGFHSHLEQRPTWFSPSDC